jgi:hypothetical protein
MESGDELMVQTIHGPMYVLYTLPRDASIASLHNDTGNDDGHRLPI